LQRKRVHRRGLQWNACGAADRRGTRAVQRVTRERAQLSELRGNARGLLRVAYTSYAGTRAVQRVTRERVLRCVSQGNAWAAEKNAARCKSQRNAHRTVRRKGARVMLTRPTPCALLHWPGIFRVLGPTVRTDRYGKWGTVRCARAKSLLPSGAGLNARACARTKNPRRGRK
jgi:hypothetical protein